ncbi:MAG: dihydroorotase [Candidatus Omnitrophota bacterium]
MKYLIKGGHVIDPANKIDGVCDVLISDGKIEKVGEDLGVKADETIDAKGKIVAPGFVDMHVHLREPGREDEETVYSGTRAAIKGGFTTVACMPNTEPPTDDPVAANTLRAIIKKDAACNVVIVGAITELRQGLKLAEFLHMKEAGVTAFSDDGSSVDDQALLAGALSEAAAQGLVIIEHCEDRKLSAGGVMNAGLMATKMGLKGISRASEYERAQRNVDLARRKLSAIHIAHVSCKESVDLIRKAKYCGIKVTAEIAPHYFTLTEDCCATYDTNTKMNPPLRSKEDVEAVKKGLADGTIDCIATDHAPHTDAEKDVEFDSAPFGIIGLETALGLAVTELIDKKALSWSELIIKMSVNPAGILGIGKGVLSAGSPADIVIIDPDKEYIYKKDSIESKSKNSPFIDWKLKAKVTHVFVGGKQCLL